MDRYMPAPIKKQQKPHNLQTPYYPATEVEKHDISKASEMNQ